MVSLGNTDTHSDAEPFAFQFFRQFFHDNVKHFLPVQNMQSNLDRVQADIQARLRLAPRALDGKRRVRVVNNDFLIDYYVPEQLSSLEDHHESCSHCRAQYRSIEDQKSHIRGIYADAVSDGDAQRTLDAFLAQTHDGYDIISAQVNKYGDTIINRWKRKSRAQKQAILLAVAPNMPTNKWKIIDMFCERTNWFENPAEQNTHLLPYLSVENLLEDPRKLLALLHSRTTSPPEAWAMHDSEHLATAWNTFALRTQYHDKCVVMHGLDYGKLVPYDLVASHHWDAIGYPRARLILEAQSILYSFLRKFLEALLSGVGIEGSRTKWETLTAEITLAGRSARTSCYRLPVVTEPPVLAPEVLYSLADVRRAAAEDDLWLLQTDVPYIQHVATQVYNSTVVQQLEEEYRWPETVGEVLVDAINRAGRWQCIAAQCQVIQGLYAQYSHIIGPGKSLPLEYNRSLLALKYMCGLFATSLMQRIGRLLTRMKGSSGYYKVAKNADGYVYAHMEQLMDKERRVIFDLKVDPLYYAIFYLFEPCSYPPSQQISFSAGLLLDYLEDHLAHAPHDDKKRLDRCLYDSVSDIAALDQILSALKCHRPVLFFDADNCDGNVLLQSQTASRAVEARATPFSVRNVKILAEKLKHFVEAPWPKGIKDDPWLAQATENRRRLSMLWTEMHGIRRCHGNLLRSDPQAIEDGIKLISADTSEEYLAEVKAEKEVVERYMASVDAKKVGRTCAEIVDFNKLALKSEVPSENLVRKEKAKTRPAGGLNATDRVANGTPVGEINTAAVTPHITISKHNMPVFAILFPAIDEPVVKSGIHWNHFLAAMTDAGYEVAPSGGSAVTFSEAAGSILFHRPHPEPKIKPTVLGAMARRLRRRFSWCREVFVEREKIAA